MSDDKIKSGEILLYQSGEGKDFYAFVQSKLHFAATGKTAAELMAEDEQLMSMQDWLNETDQFLTNNRRNVLEGKGNISHDAAVKKAGEIYAVFRKQQDECYISQFDREAAKYLHGGEPK